MTGPDSWKRICAAFLFCFTGAICAPAQVTFTTLVKFDGFNGKDPSGPLVQGFDGDLYGVTYHGGANYGDGLFFNITPGGKQSRLYSFCALTNCSDGVEPDSGLVQATDGNFYGMTYQGGDADYCGTVFEITATGKLNTLHSFDGTDGCAPEAGLIQAADGNFYGMTWDGGVNGRGTVFKMTPAGALTTLYNFCSLADCADGFMPYGSLVQATNGNFYGTTSEGGANANEFCYGSCGTVFEITPAGTLTTLYSFCSLADCGDGSRPSAALVQGIDGDFYGTADLGGGYGRGTVFKMTPEGTVTTLYSFCSLANCADGAYPFAPLVQATDGNFYGTTSEGGYYGGTVFKMTPEGTLTTLYSFCSQTLCLDGEFPDAGLLQATNGTFYGVTSEGGTRNYGTIFSLSTGLGPFVSFVRNPAKVGQEFGILGQGLTGTTNVSLNGTSASFTVRSDTLLTATVPAGATSGYVSVTTPTDTLTSNVPFYVIP